MNIRYKSSFIRQLKKLELSLQHEALRKIELFKDPSDHKQLRVHKLRGRLKGSYSFSIDYKNRIVFEYEKDGSAALMAIGDHEVYE